MTTTVTEEYRAELACLLCERLAAEARWRRGEAVRMANFVVSRPEIAEYVKRLRCPECGCGGRLWLRDPVAVNVFRRAPLTPEERRPKPGRPRKSEVRP